jgi:hypothetical protein
MRSLLKKAGPSERTALYRAWLSLPALERPYVSEELGYALAADFPALDSSAASELGGLLEAAMGRGHRLWDDRGDSREKLAAAMLDRGETDLAKRALSCAALSPRPLPLTKPRAAKLIALLRSSQKIGDAESRVLWSAAWLAMSKGAEGAYARELAELVAELSGYSLWTMALRLPSLSPGGLPASFPEAKAQAGAASPPSRLLLALAAAVDPKSLSPIKLEQRYPENAVLSRLVASRVGKESPADIAGMKAIGDWDSGYALLRSALGAKVFSEAELLALLDSSRPTQSAAALSLLPKPLSASALAALRSVAGAARDPVLLASTLRILSTAVESAAVAGAAPASGAAANLPPGEAYSLFSPFVDASAPEVRVAAISGLASLRDGRADETLGARLLDPLESSEVKAAAAKALGAIGDAPALRSLIGLLASPPPGDRCDEAARAYAAIGLGERRDAEAVSAILGNIDPSREADINYHCVVALGRISWAPGADRSGLAGLLSLAAKAPPPWKSSAGSKTAGALYWALLPLVSADSRALYLDRWNARAASKGVFDFGAWCSALYLLKAAPSGWSGAEKAAWEAYLGDKLSAAAAEDCVMVGEALDLYPVASVLLKDASILGGLDPYAKSWLVKPLIHNPESEMLGAFRSLLDCEDDYLAYASLAAVDRLAAKLNEPLSPELRKGLSEYRDKLAALSSAQLARGTGEWRDTVRRRLDYLLK